MLPTDLPPSRASRPSKLPVLRSLASAVVLGVTVDLGGSLIALAYLFAYGVVGAIVSAVASGGTTPPAPSLESAAFLAAGLAIGSAFSLLGGYVAARLRPDRAVIAGILTGAFTCLVAFVPSVLLGGPVLAPALELLAYALAFLAAILGSALVRRRPPIPHGSA